MKPNRILICAAGLVAASATASIANADDWTGASIGIGGGYGLANNELTFSPGALLDPDDFNVNINGLSGTGGFFTVALGYDHRIAPSIVVGAFIDYDFSNIETTASLAVPPLGDLSASASFEIENQLSIGARVGALVTPSTLFYVTAGYARIETTDLSGSFTIGGDTTSGVLASVGDFDGYFLGFGAETQVSDGFSVKAEYRYTDMSSEDAVLLPEAGLGLENFVRTSFQPTIQSIRLSLNYRFGANGARSIDEAAIQTAARSWTGGYLGVGGGYGAASNALGLKDASGGGFFSLGIDGFAHEGGFLAFGGGYDVQVAPRVVVGALIDADWMNLDHEDKIRIGPPAAGFGIKLSGEVDDVLMAGARIGYLTSPDTLLFASAGYANADFDDVRIGFSAGGAPVDSITLIEGERFSGFFVGAGIESRLSERLSLKAEYRYAEFGSERVTLLPDVFPEINEIVTTTFDPVVQTGRVSINYRFDGH